MTWIQERFRNADASLTTLVVGAGLAGLAGFAMVMAGVLLSGA